MSGPPVAFSNVMWAPSDKYGPLITRRRGSGTIAHNVRGTQPCSASRRGSMDARARSTLRPICIATANSFCVSTEHEKKAAKSVKWLLDEYKFPAEDSKTDNTRMPVPVRSRSSTTKPTSHPPACRPFHLLELPVYHPDDVRTELNGRLLKTLNDVVPLGQVSFCHPIYSNSLTFSTLGSSHHVYARCIHSTRGLLHCSRARRYLHGPTSVHCGQYTRVSSTCFPNRSRMN